MQLVKNNLKTRNVIKSILLTFPMALLIIVLLSDGNFHIFYSEKSIPFLITYLFFISSFFLMIYTGKTDKYRALIFILFSIFLSFSFIYNMFEVRDTMTFNETNIYESNIPFCHLVIPMIIIPAALTQTIIFPGSIIGGFASISMMIALWFFSSLAIGRGFCSWGCFYGGWDDAFSRIKKKRILKYLPGILRYASFAILLLVVISAASTLSPTYCSWICPFKTVTEFEEINSTTSVIKTIIFLSLFIGLVIIIPILTKKRTQCALFCPLGALQSGFNKINIFDIRIDKTKCTNCKKCIKICPMYSLNDEQLKKEKPDFTCSRCGKCIDVCPNNAISYHIRGTSTDKYLTLKRLLFLYPSFLFMTIFAGGSYISSISRIINWIN